MYEKHISLNKSASTTPAMSVPLGVSLSGPCASETESDEDTSATHTTSPNRRHNTHQEHLGLHRLAFLEQ